MKPALPPSPAADTPGPSSSAASPPGVSLANLHQVEAAHSLWQDAWHRLAKNRAAMTGLFFFLFVTVACIIGPWVTGYDFDDTELSLAYAPPLAVILRVERLDAAGTVERDEFTTLPKAIAYHAADPGFAPAAFTAALAGGETVQQGSRRYTPASRRHLLGNDNLGRDLLTRLLQGGRISLAVGFLATLVSILIGVIYGSISGYLGGRLDAVMMRAVDILYAMPFTIFVILLMTMFGRDLWLMFLAIGAVSWLTMARIVRGQVVSIKKQEFVEAALALGQSHGKIIFRHVIPNVLGPVIVYSTLTVPSVILFESFLSFLGLGVQPPMASWGVLIKEGAESMTVYPFQLLSPAILFSLTLLAMNFLGDGLRDALDPRTAR